MVISTVNQVVYNGDGITTAWPYTFRIIDDTDIKLAILETDGTETEISSDYYVDTVNNTVYYPGYAPGAEPPQEDQPPKVQTGQRLLIYRQLPITQEKDLGEKWPFEVIELALDKLTMILQQVYEWWGRCLKISPAAQAEHPDFDMTFPIEAGKSFRVNEAGTGFEVSEDPGISAAQAVEAATIAAAAAEAAAAAAAATELQAIWVDTMEALKSANIPAGNTAGTKGYYAVGDGGSSLYAVRARDAADVEDGGSIIFLDNGNTAELLSGDTVNVKQFGAKGDGVSNDNSAFANAIAFADGKILIIPKGNYKITENLFADSVKSVDDSGTYTNIKPCYPQTFKPIFTSTKQLSLLKNIDVGSTYSVQGICYNSDSGNLIIGAKTSGDTNQKLFIVDPTDYQVLQTYSYTELGHVNSLTYNSKTKKIYAIKDTSTVAIVDAATMAYESVVDISENQVFCLKYDEASDLFIGYDQDTGSDVLYIRHFDGALNYLRSYSATIENRTYNGLLVRNGVVLFGAYNDYLQCDYFGRNVNIIQSLSQYEVEDFCYCDSDGKIYVTYLPAYAAGICTLASFAEDVTNSSGFFGESGKSINKYDLNNIVEPGIYDVDPLDGDRSALHFPFGKGRGFMNVMRVHNDPNIGSGMQLFATFTAGGSVDLYARNRLNTPNVGGTWHNWQRLDVKGRNHKSSKTSVSYSTGQSTYSYTATSDGIFEFRCSCTGFLQMYVSNTAVETIIQGDGVKAAHLYINQGDTVNIVANGGASSVEAYFTKFEYVP